MCKEGRLSLTRRTKIAKIKKADITFAAHCHKVNVLLSNYVYACGSGRVGSQSLDPRGTLVVTALL